MVALLEGELLSEKLLTRGALAEGPLSAAY